MNATVYSKDHCPFCVRAKEFLIDAGYTIEELKVGRDLSKEEMQQTLQSKTGHWVETVPQIFIGDDYIGGCTDLEAWLVAKTPDNGLNDDDFSGFSI